MKYLLVDWGFEKSSVQYDLDAKALKVEGNLVLTISANNFVLDIKWVDAKWGEWKELQEDTQFLATVTELQGKLDSAKIKIGKGKGKGPTSA